MIATRPLTLSPIAADVFAGLTRKNKSLPPRLFYDAAGSALFEEITQLPEYYLTRTEAAILRENAGDISRLAGRDISVIELAAGSAEKTRILLRAVLRRQLRAVYVPVDVSEAALVAARRSLKQFLPRVAVQPELSDLSDLKFLRRFKSPRLVLFIGSTIGNLDYGEAITLLQRVAAELTPDDRLLLGTDLLKDPSVLLPAYDDAQGVTARFNRNVLVRINRELGGSFDTETFAHIALWNAECSRMEMHLESRVRQNVTIRDLGIAVSFERGERIHTENSYKYTLPAIIEILGQAGLQLERSWSDNRKWYALHLAQLR